MLLTEAVRTYKERLDRLTRMMVQLGIATGDEHLQIGIGKPIYGGLEAEHDQCYIALVNKDEEFGLYARKDHILWFPAPLASDQLDEGEINSALNNCEFALNLMTYLRPTLNLRLLDLIGETLREHWDPAALADKDK